MQKITDNVYVETEYRGCNPGFVVTKEGVVMINTPMIPTDATRWCDEIAKYGPVRYLINTDPTLTTRYWLVGGVTAVKVGRICAAAGAVALAVITTVGPFGRNADCSLAMFVFQGYSAARASTS